MFGEIHMPEKVLKKLNSYILPQWKACFLTAFLIGLLAHLYKITNWLPNWDSLVFRYDSQNMIALGRWFLPVVCSFSSYYDLPFLNGIVAILFHALGAVCICNILHVQKRITACMIGAIVVSFPTVTSVMMYNYVADGYSIAFFLSVLAALFMTREKPRYLLSVLLIALSTAIYQAYITITIMLVILHLIDETLYTGTSLHVTLKKGIVMLLTGIAGVLLYSVILTALLHFSSTALLDYQGIDSAASFSSIDIPGSLYSIKETFMNCFFDLSEGLNLYVILNVFTLIFTLAHYVKYTVKNQLYKTPSKLFILVLLGGMLLAGAGALSFVNAGVDYHNLMLMGYSVFYLFFLILYERGADRNETHVAAKRWTILLVALVITANQVVVSNVSYHKAQMAYEKSYGVLIRIADRIEQTPDAEKCDRILVIGALENSQDYSVNLTPDITGITDGYIIRADDESVGQSVFCSALNDYCEKDYLFLSGKEKQLLKKNAKVKAMETWPAQNSIAVVDDTIVVKLGTEGE